MMRRISAAMLTAAIFTMIGAGQVRAALTVEVNPNHLRIATGASADFAIVARDAGGFVVTGSIAWEVVPSRLGTMTPDGRFTASGVGRGIVRATVTAGGESGMGHAMVSVSPVHAVPEAAISIDPGSARVDPGGTVRFRASVGGVDPAAGGSRIEWRVVPESLGRIDATGLFVASQTPGTGHVVAQLRGEGGTRSLGEARVVVGRTAPADVQVRIRPERGIIRPGETRRFHAEVTQRNGTPVTPAPAIEWSVIPSELGRISTDGTLVAGSETTDGRVVATVSTGGGVARGYANLAVRETGGRPLAIQIHPMDAVLSPGGELRFQATVLGPEGAIPDARVEWRVEPASLGRIAPDGHFVAAGDGVNAGAQPEVNAAAPGNAANRGTSRSGRVIATTRHGGETASASARITIGERLPEIWLRVLPQRVTVKPGEQLQFRAELLGPLAGKIRPDVRWSVSSGDIGSITPAGLFTASEAVGNVGSPEFGKRDGVVTAVAMLPDGRTIQGAAIVLVRQPGIDAGVSVQPANAVLQPGHGTTFRVLVGGIDATQLGYSITWSCEPEAIGTFTGSNGEFVAADQSNRNSGVIKATLTRPGAGSQVEARARVRIAIPRNEGQGETVR